MARSPNWEKIKTEYITTNASQRDLAKKYKLSVSNIGAVAKKGNWFKEKKEYQSSVRAKAVQKAAEKESDVLSEIARLKSETALLLWKTTRKAAGKLEDAEEMDTTDFRRITQCFVDLVNLPSEAEDNEDAHNALIQAIMGLDEDED